MDFENCKFSTGNPLMRGTPPQKGSPSWGGPGVPLKRVLFTLHHDYRKKNQTCKKQKKKKIQRTDRNFYKSEHGEKLEDTWTSEFIDIIVAFCNFGSLSCNCDAKWKEPSWGGQSPFEGESPSFLRGSPHHEQVSRTELQHGVQCNPVDVLCQWKKGIRCQCTASWSASKKRGAAWTWSLEQEDLRMAINQYIWKCKNISRICSTFQTMWLWVCLLTPGTGRLTLPPFKNKILQ